MKGRSTTVVDGRVKGIPPETPPFPLERIDEKGWNLLREDLSLPAAVLRRSALRHNSRWMMDFLGEDGPRLCPHGKTTMAPALFRRQMRDGAWGMTAASVRQVMVCRAAGVQRVLLANQLVRPASVRWVLDELDGDPDFDFYCLVDSTEGARRLGEAARSRDGGRPLQLLLEVGYEGGRAGCRSVEGALEVGRAIERAGPGLRIRGVEGFEGLLGRPPDGGEAAVETYLERLVDTAVALRGHGLFADGEVILTAGGSAYFDLVTERLRDAGFPGDYVAVTRSGCYLTHDDGMYDRAFRRMLERSSATRASDPGLVPALEVWGYVLSRPEPGLVVLNVGRRDCSHDAGMPVPRHVHRPGGDDGVRPAGEEWRIRRLNDQHAYLRFPRGDDLRVGDMVGCGISHPCTTFDRWRVLVLVDDRYDVVGAVETSF